jgi:hypothetical protein
LRRKITLLAICPTATPSASAASCAVRAGDVQPQRRVRVAAVGQRARHALEALGPRRRSGVGWLMSGVMRLDRHAALGQQRRPRATPAAAQHAADEGPGIDQRVQVHAGVMPMPCSMNTTSSVATLPVAPLA